MLDKLKKELEEIKNKEQELLDQISNLEKTNELCWSPSEGDEYHYIGGWGATSTKYRTSSASDRFNLSVGNYYKLEKDAEIAIDKLNLQKEIKEWRALNDPDSFKLGVSNGARTRYGIVYSYRWRYYIASPTYDIKQISNIEFTSEAICDRFIQFFDGRLKLLFE
jgi:hypothetical protein